jgi:hypothetical protein
MNLARWTVIASAVVLMACASEPCFYSFVARSFLRLSDDPVRNELVGTWRTSEGHVLALFSDGRFGSRLRGCWDIDHNQLLFLQRCRELWGDPRQPHTTFIDQGANFESGRCPGCKIEVEIASWQEWMDKSYESEFRDLYLAMPCCGASTSLNDLIYEWPAGFARFALFIENPNIGGWLAKGQLAAVEDAVDCKLRQIYARI